MRSGSCWWVWPTTASSHLGMAYVERGYITQDEYENLRVYLYEPYEKRGGNWQRRRVMLEVDKLPVHKM